VIIIYREVYGKTKIMKQDKKKEERKRGRAEERKKQSVKTRVICGLIGKGTGEKFIKLNE
jgi:hypothetical protein